MVDKTVYDMAQATSRHILMISSVFVAGISLFSRRSLLMFFLLIFIYLLPRAGFIFSVGLFSYPLPIGYLLITFIMMRWFSSLLFERTRIKKENPIAKIFLLYIVIAILAIIIGFMNGGNIPIMIFEIAIYFAAFFVYFMALDIFSNEASIKMFINGILICGFLVSLYGVLLLLIGERLLVNYITYNSATTYAFITQFAIAKRTISSYGDPNALSAQLMVFCSIFASLLLLGKPNLPKRIFLFTGLGLIIVCIYFASSRASLVGLFILLTVFSIIKIRKLGFFIPILIMGYFMFLEPIRKYYEHRIYTAGVTSDLRVTYIKAFFDFLTHYPLGVGFGNFLGEGYTIVPAVSIWYGFNSFYLHIFSRIGIQGLMIFIVMLFLIIRYLFKGCRYIEDPDVRYFVFGSAWGLVAQQFNFITNNVYHVPGGMLNFWIMCGMSIAIINIYKVKRGIE